MKLQNTPQSPGKVEKLWSFASKERFNCIRLGTLFRQTGTSIIVGGEDGIIRIYDLPAAEKLSESKFQNPKELESKGGPIQTMCIHDVTKFYHNDLVVADSQGLLTVFCNKQILSRQSLSSDPINSLQVLQDSTGSTEIITGSDTGVITASFPSSELWRINCNDLHSHPLQEPNSLVTVTCMLVADLSEQPGIVCKYLLVADSASMVHIINQGTVVMSLKAPSVITAMTAGRFVNNNKLMNPTPSNGSNTSANSKQYPQVILGSKTGAVYILHNYSITLDEVANCNCPITQLAILKAPEKETDYLLCSGHLNSLLVFLDGTLWCEYETTDWVNSIETCDINNDGTTEIVIGCLDNTIMALKLCE